MTGEKGHSRQQDQQVRWWREVGCARGWREGPVCAWGCGGRDQCEGLDEKGRVLGNRNAELDWA